MSNETFRSTTAYGTGRQFRLGIVRDLTAGSPELPIAYRFTGKTTPLLILPRRRDYAVFSSMPEVKVTVLTGATARV